MSTAPDIGPHSGSEHSYREVFQRAPGPLLVFDNENLRFLAVNRAAMECYGYSEAEFLAMVATDLVPQEDAIAWRENLAASRQSEELEPHWGHRRKDGTIIQVEVSAGKVVFQQRPAGVLWCADITERKQAEFQTTAFSELGRRLSGARTPRDAALSVVTAANALFGWDAFLFQIYAEDNTRLRTLLRIDTIEGRKCDVTTEPGEDVPGTHSREALEHGARLILRLQTEGFPPDMHPFGDKTRPSASLMFAPIRKEAETIGVLSIQSYRLNAYDENDLRSLQVLADHCAGALERIRAEEELLRLNAELERRVQDRTAQLEAANRELEAFSYSVSHDLRAPLRGILGFSEVLLERYSPSLDQRGQEYLRRACDASRHMDRLIDSLLQLSRVGRAELQWREADLSRMAEGILDELRRSEPNRPVVATVAPGLRACGDERLLHIVLQNLLRNAWKFTSHRANAAIEVGFEPGKSAFFVRDNGAGFDMAYASRLFGVFQRLHSASEFPGSGVGLATVQRIVNRHGGRAWGEAAVEQGATFYFSLPQHEPANCK